MDSLPVHDGIGWATKGGPLRVGHLSALVARDLDGNRRKVSKVDTKCMCVKQRLLAAWAAGEMGWYP